MDARGCGQGGIRSRGCAAPGRRGPVALAAILACALPGLARAADDIPLEYTTPASRIEGGVLWNSEDSFEFGDFLGFHEGGTYFVGNLDLWGGARYDSPTPSYWHLEAANLGLSSRKLQLEYGQQGRFDLDLGFEQIPKQQLDTGAQFMGRDGATFLALPAGWVADATTAGMTALAASLGDLALEHERQRLNAGVSFLPSEKWKLHSRFQRETKQGTRLVSALIAASGGNPRATFLPETLDHHTRTLDVGLEYGGGDRGHFTLDYHLSSFHNRDESLTWENPYLDPGGWAAAAGFPAGIGRKGQAPDNRFDQISFAGGYALSPTTRLTLNGALGRMQQDETFLPYTVNPGLVVTTPLPRRSAEAEIWTTAMTLGVHSRPSPRWALDARFRYDDRDNETPKDVFLYVPSDATDQGAVDDSRARVNRPYSRKLQELTLDARYRLSAKSHLKLGYEYEEVDRNFVEVDTTREHMIEANLQTRPADWMTLRLKLGGARRRGGSYTDFKPFWMGHSQQYIALQAGVGLWEDHPLLRKHILADRQRLELGLSGTMAPSERLTVGFDASHLYDDYEDTEVGLAEERRTRVMLDVAYAVSEHASAYLFYGFEGSESEQNGWSFRGFAKAAESVDPGRRWSTGMRDLVNTLGVGFEMRVPRRKLTLSADYLYAITRNRNDTDVGPVLGVALPFPDAVTRLHDVRVSCEYELRKGMSLRAGYLYEKLDLDDWAVDHIQPATIAEVITLGAAAPRHQNHLVTWSVIYEF